MRPRDKTQTPRLVFTFGWPYRMWAMLMVVFLLVGLAQAQAPSKNIESLGVPAIPSSLARELQPYSSPYGLPVAGWNPLKREIWLKGLSSVTWISRVASPGATPETSAIYIQSSGIYDIYFQPQGRYLAYTRDANGNEAFQLYLDEISARN